jgi:hypothetical protein
MDDIPDGRKFHAAIKHADGAWWLECYIHEWEANIQLPTEVVHPEAHPMPHPSELEARTRAKRWASELGFEAVNIVWEIETPMSRNLA